MSWASWDDGNSPTIVVGRTRNLYGHNKGMFAAVVQRERKRKNGKKAHQMVSWKPECVKQTSIRNHRLKDYAAFATALSA